MCYNLRQDRLSLVTESIEWRVVSVRRELTVSLAYISYNKIQKPTLRGTNKLPLEIDRQADWDLVASETAGVQLEKMQTTNLIRTCPSWASQAGFHQA